MKVQMAFNIKIADSFVDDFTYGINLKKIFENLFLSDSKATFAYYLMMSNTNPQS